MNELIKECPNCGTAVEGNVCPACGTEFEEEISLDDEFGAEFENELESISEKAEENKISSEIGFGFPDWDLLPPR